MPAPPDCPVLESKTRHRRRGGRSPRRVATGIPSDWNSEGTGHLARVRRGSRGSGAAAQAHDGRCHGVAPRSRGSRRPRDARGPYRRSVRRGAATRRCNPPCAPAGPVWRAATATKASGAIKRRTIKGISPAGPGGPNVFRSKRFRLKTFYDHGPLLTTHGMGQQRGAGPQLLPRIPVLSAKSGPVQKH